MKFELGTIAPEQVVKYFQVSTRIDRAVGIVDHVVRDAPGICIVQSATKPKVKYVTDTRAGTCTCEDWLYRGSIENIPCKHILAGRIRERLN